MSNVNLRENEAGTSGEGVVMQNRETCRQVIIPPRRNDKDGVQPLLTGNNAH